MDILLSPDVWVALLALLTLEIVLGVDNLVFISLMTTKLPEPIRPKIWKTGLGLAAGMRIILLFAAGWVIGLTEPLFTVFNYTVTGRNIVLLLGGVFLFGKAVVEIHEQTEHGTGAKKPAPGGIAGVTTRQVLIQIVLLDLVFSLDSVITAVGLTEHIPVMIVAILAAVAVMLWLAQPVMKLVTNYPTIKMLALAFLLLIGVTLVAEGSGAHLPKGYIYSAMGFAVLVELLNMRMFRNSRRRNPATSDA